ncbi:MAG TPA: PhnD/SsuA/transferrin family substrate-binding protein [Caldimonas sp.]|nr:PhnD/SsuA/transferrin family substrate-binding protein [Caldimonas sp.]
MSIVPIVNTRMYSVAPTAAADWRTVLSWVLLQADLDWPFVEVPPPAPIAELWARGDLGLAMMCGLPYGRRVAAGQAPTLVAAPVPSPPRYQHRPVYMTDFVVAAVSRHRTLEDTFGGTVGYTLADSLSGGVAPLHHLSRLRTASRDRPLYAGAVGDLVHARGVIEAIDDGRIDVGPLDGYAHDLLRKHDPWLAAKVRTVATTDPLPIPPLVATAPLTEDQLARLREALLAAHEAPVLHDAMARLLLERFVVPGPEDYAPLAALSRADTPAFEDL